MISYKSKFIDSAGFMVSSLPNLVNNVAEGINKIKCKYRHDQNVKCVELNTKVVSGQYYST